MAKSELFYVAANGKVAHRSKGCTALANSRQVFALRDTGMRVCNNCGDKPKRRQPSWRIQTSGPGFTFNGTLADVKAHVEKYAPLKRGWTGKWITKASSPRNAAVERRRTLYYYVRTNSKGRAMGGYSVLVYQIGR